MRALWNGCGRQRKQCMIPLIRSSAFPATIGAQTLFMSICPTLKRLQRRKILRRSTIRSVESRSSMTSTASILRLLRMNRRNLSTWSTLPRRTPARSDALIRFMKRTNGSWRIRLLDSRPTRRIRRNTVIWPHPELRFTTMTGAWQDTQWWTFPWRISLPGATVCFRSCWDCRRWSSCWSLRSRLRWSTARWFGLSICCPRPPRTIAMVRS